MDFRLPDGSPGLPRQVANPWDPAQVTVDNCDREPIHIPGLIQPNGALVAFDPASGIVWLRRELRQQVLVRVEAMDGELAVDSELGRGSRFCVFLAAA
jgi:hypothetical protein